MSAIQRLNGRYLNKHTPMWEHARSHRLISVWLQTCAVRSFSLRPRSHSRVSNSNTEKAISKVAAASQPFQGQQQQHREGNQQGRGGSNRRAEVFTDAAEHLPRQGRLLRAGKEQRHDHFIE